MTHPRSISGTSIAHQSHKPIHISCESEPETVLEELVEVVADL